MEPSALFVSSPVKDPPEQDGLVNDNRTFQQHLWKSNFVVISALRNP